MPFPIEEVEIEKTEKELGNRLPNSYRASMKTDNGGSIKALGDVWDLYPLKNTASKKLIIRTANDVIRETKAAREWPGFPDNAIAIASNGSGDLIVLIDSGDAFRNSVYRWDHETSEVSQLSSDFSELEKI